MNLNSSLRVAIVGGGFSGTMTAYHLLRLSPSADVTIFEQHPQQIARGNAYAPSSPHHLLNVPAEAMGAVASDAGEFLRWLHAQGHNISGKTFAPRAWYGNYLSELRGRLHADFPNRIRTVTEEVVGARRLDSSEVEVLTASGTSYAFNHLVIASGTTPRAIATEGSEQSCAKRIIMSPWQSSVFDHAAKGETIAIIGSGLSAIDILVESTKLNFSGSFLVIAPHGAFPCLHAEELTSVPALPTPPPWSTVRQALQGLRALTGKYTEWQHAIDAVRPHLNALWSALPEHEKRRFFRHAAILWDRHRHRMPRSAGAAIEELRRAGRLTVHAGYVSRVHADESGVTVLVQQRGSRTTKKVSADRAVNCSGFTLDVTRLPSAFARSLLSNKLGYPGGFGLGWRCDPEGALCTPQGDRINGIWAMGSLRRSSEFECTAAREIRAQAEALAHSILLYHSVKQAGEAKSAARSASIARLAV